MKIHCDNCGASIQQQPETSFLYECHMCGHDMEIGQAAKPLTIEHWVAVQRRLLGDLSRKLDGHRDVKTLIRINEAMSRCLEM